MGRDYLWIGIFLALAVTALIGVPRRRLARLLPLGLVAGGALVMTIELIAVPLLSLWTFNTGLLTFTGIPLFLVLAWIPGIALYARYLESLHSRLSQAIYVGAWAAAATLVDWLSISTGLLDYRRWNLLSTFGLWGLTLSAIAYYVYEVRMTDIDETGIRWD